MNQAAPLLDSEVTVLATQCVIDALAERVELAYRIRRLGWLEACSSPRVWSVAAETLFRAHNNDPTLPLDPELFVASQPSESSFPDPWGELTHEESVGRYRERVAEIVRRLHDELAGEVRKAEERIEQGEPIVKILLSRSRRLSPLGRYIAAHRAGRPALANRFRQAAWEQHRSCPLYRRASAGLLSEGVYPIATPRDLATTPPPTQLPSRPRSQVHLN